MTRTTIKTWTFASKQTAPVIERGTIIIAYGFAMAMQRFVVTDPETRRCIELRSIQDGVYLDAYFSPEHTLNKNAKLLKDKFGIGFYIDPDSPKATEEQIADAEVYLEAYKLKLDLEKAAKEQADAEETERLRTRYAYLKLKPEWSERIQNVRLWLKYEFPKTKCTVRGGSTDSITITVYSEDKYEVEEIRSQAKIFQDHHSDWSGDYMDYDPSIFNNLYGGFKYVFADAK